MARKKAPPAVPFLTLRVNDLLFVNAYLSNGRSAVQAYRTAHPNAKYSTCKVEAYRILAKPSVKTELAKRLQTQQGWTRDVAVSHVLDLVGRAQQQGKMDVELRAYTELNDLAGLKVFKHEDVGEKIADLSPAERSSRLSLLRQQFPQLALALVES